MATKAAIFSLAEVFPVVASTIRELTRFHGKFVTHKEIVAALLKREELDVLLDHLVATDPEQKPRTWWANNFVQWFSHHFTRGTSEFQTQFERQRIGSGWSYRPRL